MSALPTFNHISLEVKNQIAFVELARPDKANALNKTLWFEIESVAIWADQTPEVRVMILSGQRKAFLFWYRFLLGLCNS